MKTLSLVLLLLTTSISFSQPLNRTFESANGRITLLGEASIERLNEEPFGEWYKKNHDEYQVNEASMDLEKADSITIFMGTWCGDSRREVPRFVKILEASNYDLSKLKILCLNTGFQNYKQAPEREEQGMNIHRVPTFIFHNQEGGEIGRIVEEPVVSLEKDIHTVLSGQEYSTAYPIAQQLIKYLDQYSMKDLRKMKSKLVNEFKAGENFYELNTYGYVLWTSFQIPEAQFVFELNASLFPDEPMVHQTLARFMNSLGENKVALASVQRGLKIEPENEKLLEMRAQLLTKE
ncbi:thioredoxin family protein [Ekhidna sp.]|uniref:thioredoxin family protein n=1 Tax=Ekhidna sp. TaxID=2608089 RepID=UPI003BA9B743